MTEMQQKIAALMAVAEAFFSRGENIQYDQLSMDRILRVTPRNRRYASPEEATAQHRLFLDCARFVHSVYHTVFGCNLEADVTWNMMELVKPRIYDYRPTHQETEQDRQRIRDEVLSLLQPGDALVMRYSHNGHIILCGEHGCYYHCSEKGRENSYHYAEKRDSFTPGGTIYRDRLTDLFEPGPYDLLRDKILRFSVLRPVERMGPLTPAALARLGDAAKLQISALSSHSGGQTVRPGDTVTYTVQVQNTDNQTRAVHIELAPAPGSCLLADSRAELTLSPGQTAQAVFPLTVTAGAEAYLPPPDITVNGLPVWAERVLLHGNLPQSAIQSAAASVEKAAAAGSDIMAAAAEAYRPLGIQLPNSAPQLLTDYFLRYDSIQGDILWRKPQHPHQDGSLYSYFGGIGVITPEADSSLTLRTKLITPADLCPGDLILCSDDALFISTYTCLVTEKGLLGRFEAGGKTSQLTGADLERFIDSLPGRFCYAVVRPGVLWRAML